MSRRNPDSQLHAGACRAESPAPSHVSRRIPDLQPGWRCSTPLFAQKPAPPAALRGWRRGFLRGEAAARQVEGARIAAAENGGGFLGVEEAATVVTILERASA